VVRDHFELLGVTPEADPDEVQLAYARLARSLHPDACRDPLLAGVDAQREAVFLRVRRAYEILRDPEARAAYERDLKQRRPRPASRPDPTTALFRPPVPNPPAPTPPAPAPAPSPPAPSAPEPPAPPSAARPAAPPPTGPPPVSPPAHAASRATAAPPPSLEERLAATIGKGEALLADGQYWEAIRQIEPTLQQARGALRIRARLALARACRKNPKWGKRAEAHLQDVLEENPLSVEAHLLLGDVYRDGGLHARAVAMYRRVLDLQPHHRVARRELAHLEAEHPEKGGGGLLDFLKKR
jgi:tetratricopeptide (TPR) repeat protein